MKGQKTPLKNTVKNTQFEKIKKMKNQMNKYSKNRKKIQ